MRNLVYFSSLLVFIMASGLRVNAQGDDGFYLCAQEIEDLAWRPDSGLFVVQGLSNIKMYSPDLLTINSIEIETRPGISSDSPVACSGRGIDWSPDGNYFVVPFHEGASTPISMELQVFNYNSKEVIQELEIAGAFDIIDVDWSEDGRRIAAIYRHWGPPTTEWSLKVWYRSEPGSVEFVGTSDIGTLWTLETVRLNDLAWSPDGEKLAISKANGDITIWDTSLQALELSSLTSGGSPPENQSLNAGHGSSVNAIAWHPSDNILATGSEDGLIKVWDMNDNVELATIVEQTNAITVLDWHPDGNFLAAGDADGLIKIWDVKEEKFVDALEWHQYVVHTLDWSPDGNYISSAARDHSLRIWDVSRVGAE